MEVWVGGSKDTVKDFRSDVRSFGNCEKTLKFNLERDSNSSSCASTTMLLSTELTRQLGADHS